MAETQDRLLAHAATLLRPGGRLVYAVCSLQEEEGAPRVRRLLAQGGWRVDPIAEGDLPEGARTDDGFMRTHPAMWGERGGMDGFFAARLVREGA
jgi:16S rRNA (cytosine967-C5)-methyltransferase